MGVLGLTSFIESLDYEKSFKLDYKLKNTKIIVDGLCLLYKIYTVYHIDCAYGGNYDELCEALNDLFGKFKQCGLEVIVLFDGARDASDRKLNTTLKRARDRMKNATLDLESNSLLLVKDYQSKSSHKVICFNSSILPINAFIVFIDVLKKFNIKYYQCCFEADYEIACLANYLECPLISSDSDFYVYKLKYGYIALETLDLTPIKDEDTQDWYLNCILYKLETFTQAIGIVYDELLPILAVLCGNDYVESKKFDPLLKSFKNDNNNSRKALLKLNSSKNTKLSNFKRVLNWLNSHENKDDCVEVILKFIKNDEKAEFRQIIKESIDEYLLLKDNQPILDSILNNKQTYQDVLSFSAKLLSNEFLNKYNRYEYSRMFLDLLIHRKIILSSQVEMLTLPSSYSSSMELRKLLYYLIIQKYDTEKNDFVIQEYMRYKREIKIHQVEISIDFYKRLVESIDGDEHEFYKHLFCLNDSIINNLKTNISLTKEIKFLFVLIYFWIYNTNDTCEIELANKLKNINSIRSFIVSFIKINFIDKIFDTCERNTSLGPQDPKNFIPQTPFTAFDEYSKLIYECFTGFNFDYLKELHAKLYHFKSINKRINNNNTIKYIHCLSEFQAIYQSIFYLNQFYNENLFTMISLETFFNGTVLTNFQHELESRVNPHLYCEELFGRKSVFKSLFEFLFMSFIDMFGIDYKTNEEQPKLSNRQQKRKERKKLKKQQPLLELKELKNDEEDLNDEAEQLELKLVIEI